MTNVPTKSNMAKPLVNMLSKIMQGTSPAPKSSDFVFVDKKDVKSDVLPSKTSSTTKLCDDISTDTKSVVKSGWSDKGIKWTPEQSAAIFDIMSAEYAAKFLRERDPADAPQQWKRYQTFTNPSSVVSTSNGSFVSLSEIAQGSTITQRLGLQIFAHKVKLRGMYRVSMTQTAPTAVPGLRMPRLRMIVVADRMGGLGNVTAFSSGAVADFTGILDQYVASNLPSTMPYNLATHGTRYEILRDMIITPKKDGYAFVTGSQGYSTWELVDEEIPINKMITYSGTAGTTDQKNGLFALFTRDFDETGGWVIATTMEMTADLHYRDVEI